MNISLLGYILALELIFLKNICIYLQEILFKKCDCYINNFFLFLYIWIHTHE